MNPLSEVEALNVVCIMWLLLVVKAEPGKASVVATSTMVLASLWCELKIFKGEVSSLGHQGYVLLQQRIALHAGQFAWPVLKARGRKNVM